MYPQLGLRAGLALAAPDAVVEAGVAQGVVVKKQSLFDGVPLRGHHWKFSHSQNDIRAGSRG